jgi:hypothetical protein
MSWITDKLLGIRRILFAGLEFPERGAVNFTGAGVTVSDNPSEKRTEIDIAVVALDSSIDVQPDGIRAGYPGAITQEDFYVDWDDGDDDNDGTSENEAIKTIERLEQLLARGVVDGRINGGTVFVHILSADHEENIELVVRCSHAGRLLIYDDRAVAARAIASHPITSRVNWSTVTPVEASFTCSAIPTTIAALPSGGGVGYLAVITASATSDHVGASTWVVAETSARTALCPGWWQPDLFGTIDASVGDTVAFCRLRKLSGSVTVRVEGNGRVEFQDLEVGTSEEAHSVNVPNGSVRFTRCLVHGFDAGAHNDAVGFASVTFISSRTHNGCRTRHYSQTTLWATCHTRSVSSALNAGGKVFVSSQSLVYQNPVVVDPTGEIYIDGSISVYGASVGLEADARSWTWVIGVMWGRNITSTFLRLQRFARVLATNEDSLVIVGTSPTNAYDLADDVSASLTLPAGEDTSTSIELL